MFSLPALPYAYDALQPVMSDKTLHHHHDKHHAKYVDTLNTLLASTPEQSGVSLEEVIAAARAGKTAKVFNNAAQAWNHAFFWLSMSPEGGSPQTGLRTAIDTTFGGLEGLKSAFVAEGVGHFASGWVWLISEGGKLKVVSTHDAETMADRADVSPLLVADLWEHAYYLDYQQDREGFLKAWFDKSVDWSFVSRQFEASKDGGQGAYRYPSPQQRAA